MPPAAACYPDVVSVFLLRAVVNMHLLCYVTSLNDLRRLEM